MLGLDPQRTVLVTVAVVLAVAAVVARRMQEPGHRLAFFLRVAKDAAIVLTVVALLIQLRNATLATRQDAYSRSLDYYAQLHRVQVDNPNILGMLYGPNDRFSALVPADQERYQYLVQVVEFYQRLWLMHRDGVLDDELWAGWERWLEDGIVTIPLFRTVWEDERHYYHPDFVAYVDGKQADAGQATPPADEP